MKTTTIPPSSGAPAQPAQPSQKNNHRRRVLLSTLTIIFLTLGVLYAVYWFGWGRFLEYTDDAYVNGNLVTLMPQISGTITSINTDNTYLANKGQTLIKLDESDTAVALQRASANLAQTVRQVRQYFENVRSALAAVKLRQANLDKAQQDLQRRKGLVGDRAISAEELQHNATTVQASQAQLDQSLYALSSAISLVENSHLYEHPLVESAKATFKVAYLNWVRTTINAPVTGYIAKRSAQVGEQVTPGTALLAIVPLDEVWIDANFKETQLERIRIGQDVTLSADANDGVTYHGKVQGLSPGTGAAFDLLPPQNATGNWIKIVQRLPVRIVLDKDEIEKNPLRIGLSMRVTVHTRDTKGDVLTKVPNDKPLYSTDIFSSQLADADQLITKIVTENAPDVYLKGMPLSQEKENA